MTVREYFEPDVVKPSDVIEFDHSAYEATFDKVTHVEMWTAANGKAMHRTIEVGQP